MNQRAPVFTIGHSSHPIEEFITLLRRHQIEAIADVRSSPYSKFNPQFNREVLQRSLSDAGISYVFLGEELGARRSEPACYHNHKVSYDRVAKTESFRAGIQRVVQGSSKMRVALMCAEKDPLTCHRTILVARHLQPQVELIKHILENGSLESQSDAEKRLLEECGLSDNDLFLPLDQRIAKAYTQRGSEIAYVEPAPTEP